GLVLELFVSEEKLLASGPDKLSAAVHAPETLVLELHRSPPLCSSSRLWLLQLAPELLAVSLSRQRLLGAPLVSRFQVERVLLDVLDDVFLLNLALKAAEGALDGLAFLNLYFSHAE